MWPGDQQHPGGQRNPSNHPEQQPRNPYQKPPGGAYPPQPPQQPYGTPQYGAPPPGQAGPPASPFGPAPQPWGAPGPAARPPGPPGRRRGTVVAAALTGAVVLAAGVTAVLMTRGGGGTPRSHVSSASGSASPGPAGGGGTRDSDNKPTVPGWQVVANAQHEAAYDVPGNWVVKGSSWYDVFGDADGNPKIAVTGAAHLQEDYCGLGSPLAGTGVRGHTHATSLPSAAHDDAVSTAYYGFNDFKGPKGRLTSTAPVPFGSRHGVHGYLATASESFGKPGRCTRNGTVYVIAWLDAHHEVSEWVLWTGTGAAGAPTAGTIATVEASLRADS